MFNLDFIYLSFFDGRKCQQTRKEIESVMLRMEELSG
jgi:hypothetical protein